jgi:Phosphotransferase enzyme family
MPTAPSSDLPAEVVDLVGREPEPLIGYGSCLVFRGRGRVAKVGVGAEREAFVLGLPLPLQVPRLVAAGPGWVVMDEVADRGDPWPEAETWRLLDDLAILHAAFADVDELRGSPIDCPLAVYFDRISAYGNRAGVVLPPELDQALTQPQPLLEVLEQAERTLVHGDPYRRNIRRPDRTQRVWIDWEDATIAPAGLDLAAWLLDGPWHYGRSFDRDAMLTRYLNGPNVVARPALEPALDAAVVLITSSQDIVELQATMGSAALDAFVTDRLDALNRLSQTRGP